MLCSRALVLRCGCPDLRCRAHVLCRSELLQAEVLPPQVLPSASSLLQAEVLRSDLLCRCRAHVLCRSELLQAEVLPPQVLPPASSLLQAEVLRPGVRTELLRLVSAAEQPRVSKRSP